jgi:hypothetical protein
MNEEIENLRQCLEAKLDEQHEHCTKENKDLYIPWKWAVGFIFGLLGVIVASVSAGSTASGRLSATVESIEKKNSDQDNRIDRLEAALSTINSINSDVKEILRRIEQ